MSVLTFFRAIDEAIAQRMADDPRVVLFGEDVRLLHHELYVRFGPRRVRDAPISEAAFLGAAVGAAMAGLRPLVEIMMVDFLPVALDALVNQASKLETFSGGAWRAPMVVRTPCGGWYGDAGQHEQSLWGWLAHIPGLTVVVPSSPADAAGLMLSSLAHPGPVVYLEHKLLSEPWLELMGRGGRDTVEFDVPAAGARGEVPSPIRSIPIGQAAVLRQGTDLVMVSVGVGVHRALEAADRLATEGVSAGVLDLRSVSPIDRDAIRHWSSTTGRMLVVDEDYEAFGLSGEIAAITLEAGISVRFARVATREVIPYAHDLETQELPNTRRIIDAARRLLAA